MDSLDFVKAVMVLEEVLGIEIPDDEAEHFGSPREVVDCGDESRLPLWFGKSSDLLTGITGQSRPIQMPRSALL